MLNRGKKYYENDKERLREQARSRDNRDKSLIIYD